MRVTRENNEECRRLLQLMGVPVIDAPSEAEAQCAQLCKENLVGGWVGGRRPLAGSACEGPGVQGRTWGMCRRGLPWGGQAAFPPQAWWTR